MDRYQSLTSSKLTDIAEVRRVEKNRVYPQGTVYIQVSACNKSDKDKWMIMKEPGSLDSKYAVVVPKIDIDADYLRIALEDATPKWFARYVGTNINISMDAFKFFVVKYTEDKATQRRYGEMVKSVEEEMALIQESIEKGKKVKQWYLTKMFI